MTERGENPQGKLSSEQMRKQISEAPSESARREAAMRYLAEPSDLCDTTKRQPRTLGGARAARRRLRGN